MTLVEYGDVAQMMERVADRVADELRAELGEAAKATLAVPGGTTPGPIFDVLCKADLDWSRVRILLTDERWVPETSERSNTRLLRERLLVERAAAVEYVPLYRAAPAPEDALEILSASLDAIFPISVLLLGMGADMHTASLFPGADRLEDGLSADAPPLLPMRAPGAPEPRVTLTAPVLKAAKRVHVIIKGDEKRTALQAAETLPVLEAPIGVVLDQASVHWAR